MKLKPQFTIAGIALLCLGFAIGFSVGKWEPPQEPTALSDQDARQLGLVWDPVRECWEYPQNDGYDGYDGYGEPNSEP